MSNVINLFEKKKRVVGWNANTGKRTAHSLKKEGAWQELMDDIYHADTIHKLARCLFYWSVKIEKDHWPDEWVSLAQEEFDKARSALLQAE